jgi:hypothetical protein
MVSSTATTVEQYLSSLPAERRDSIARVRDVVRSNLPAGYQEGMQWGMIAWFIPMSRFADTYNGQPLCLAGLAAQKNHNALYMMTVYGDKKLEKTFKAGFKAAGKKLDMGKSCVRFKKADALALDVIGDTIGKVTVDQYIEAYEETKGSVSAAKKKGNVAALSSSKKSKKTKAEKSKKSKSKSKKSKKSKKR